MVSSGCCRNSNQRKHQDLIKSPQGCWRNWQNPYPSHWPSFFSIPLTQVWCPRSGRKPWLPPSSKNVISTVLQTTDLSPSQLCAGKLCEHVIAKSIMNHLEENKLLCDNQHGFRKMRSCASQLIQFVEELAKSLVGGRQVDVAIMDFSKVFDAVPHQHLLRKLEFYGIGGSSLVWIEDFLTGRMQQVHDWQWVLGRRPRNIRSSTGGQSWDRSYFCHSLTTCLSVSLPNVAFLPMTASSIEKCAPTETAPNYKMIWTLWSVGRKPGECASIPQSVTSFIFQGKKNQYCRSTISRAQIWMRWILLHILGFTPQATWPGTSKWTKWLQKGIVHSDSPNENIRTTSQATKELAYCTLVRPVMEYAASVWSPHLKGHKEVLEKVQWRAARYVLHEYGEGTSPTSMIHRLKWESLEQRRLKACVIMAYRIVHKLVKIPSDQFVPTASSTRRHDMRFHRIYNKTNYYKYSFFPSVIKLWNALPSSVVSASTLEDFKEKLADVHLKPP